MKYGKVKNYVNGEFVEVNGKDFLPVESPLNGEIIAETPLCDNEELDVIVEKAKEAQKAWGALTYKKRTEVIFNYRELLHGCFILYQKI